MLVNTHMLLCIIHTGIIIPNPTHINQSYPSQLPIIMIIDLKKGGKSLQHLQTHTQVSLYRLSPHQPHYPHHNHIIVTYDLKYHSKIFNTLHHHILNMGPIGQPGSFQRSIYEQFGFIKMFLVFFLSFFVFVSPLHCAHGSELIQR